jgi:hypothetical protein
VADYTNRTPDGRIPQYTKGGSLIGFFTPMQMMAKGLGMGTLDVQKEYQLMDYLVKQRDTLRGYRKEYVQAMVQNDFDTAGEINEDFKKHFPSFGDIQVKQKDIQAAKSGQMIGRLEKILDTMPKDLRPVYAEMIGQAMSNEAVNLMGVDPAMLQQGTWKSRPRQGGTQGPVQGQGSGVPGPVGVPSQAPVFQSSETLDLNAMPFQM